MLTKFTRATAYVILTTTILETGFNFEKSSSDSLHFVISYSE